MDFYYGQILLWSGRRIPENFMACNGQIIQVNSGTWAQALYTIIGNTYGGTAPTSFALPNLNPVSDKTGSATVQYIICTSGMYPEFNS